MTQPIPCRRGGARKTAPVLAAALALVLARGGLAAYAGYRVTYDLPTPWWTTFSKSFHYTPEQGPPRPVCFEARTKTVVRAPFAGFFVAAQPGAGAVSAGAPGGGPDHLPHERRTR